MRPRHFLFVESNTTGTGGVAVTRLLAAGERVTFLARRPAQYPFLPIAAPGLNVVEMDTNDLAAVERRVAQELVHGLDAALTFSEFYVATVAEVAVRHGLRYLAPAAARTCRDKAATRRALAAAGRATPRFRLVASAAEVREAGGEVGFPAVVKPPDDSSSKGVRRVENPAELLAHCEALLARRSNDRGQPAAAAALVESHLEGPELSVETMTLRPGETVVVGITAKHLGPPPHFVEMGHDFPALLEAAVAERIAEEALAALAAVGYDLGPAHVELRWTAAGPVVVEINARLAGGMIPELVRHAIGIDLLAAVLDQLSGRPPRLVARRRGSAAIRFFTADRAGRLAGAAGLDAARRAPQVREVTLTKLPGAAVRPAEEAADRVGFVIAAGGDRGRVLAGVEQARALVRLLVDTAPHDVPPTTSRTASTTAATSSLPMP